MIAKYLHDIRPNIVLLYSFGFVTYLLAVVKFSQMGRNGVPPPVSGVPPHGNDVSSPFWGKSFKLLLPPEVRF